MNNIIFVVLGIIALALISVLIIKLINKNRNSKIEDDLSNYKSFDNADNYDHNTDYKTIPENGNHNEERKTIPENSDPKEYPFVKRALRVQRNSLLVNILLIFIMMGTVLFVAIKYDLDETTEDIIGFIISIIFASLITLISILGKKCWVCPNCKKELPRKGTSKGTGGIIVVDKCPHCGKDLSDVDLNDK